MAVYGTDEEKTIADALVDIFPYKRKENDGEKAEVVVDENQKNLVFVIERVYGERTPDVLLSILQTIRKKQTEANVLDVDIFISNDALTSCYTNVHHLQEEFKDEDVIIQNTELKIATTESPSKYGYYEF